MYGTVWAPHLSPTSKESHWVKFRAPVADGMIFTIEPMINQGRPETRLLGDNWTAITKDRKLSAQWEHTILVTADGYEVLTLRSEETFR